MPDSLPGLAREQRWREAVDRYFAPAAMALADREQAELREEIGDHLSWKNAETARADRAEAEAAGLREQLPRAEAFERRIRDLFSAGPDTACRTTWIPDPSQPNCPAASIECVEVPLADLRAALSADENGTRDGH